MDKKEEINPKAMDMARVMVEGARAELLKTYPLVLYEGEKQDSSNQSANEKTFQEPLTLELLEKHQKLSEECK